MYNNVIFDLYGTLVDIHTEEHNIALWHNMSQLCQAYGAQYQSDVLRELFFSLCNEHQQANALHYQYPEIDIVKVWQEILMSSTHSTNKSDATLLAKTMRLMSIVHIRLYDGVLPLLKKLKKANIPMYLLSNAQLPYITQELRMLGISGYFQDKVISAQYGMTKPNTELYNILLTKNNLDPRQSVMIGNDLTTDIQGANATGIDSIYIDNGTVLAGKGNITSTYTITNGDYNTIYNIVTK